MNFLAINKHNTYIGRINMFDSHLKMNKLSETGTLNQIDIEGKFSKKYLHSFLRNEEMNRKINIAINMAETALSITTLAIFDVSHGVQTFFQYN